ncbi:MAG: hypothetical protein M3014_05035 [Chloroflexota bacterium]|nr:hypothetical protein [Chloroflexota bacterium]
MLDPSLWYKSRHNLEVTEISMQDRAHGETAQQGEAPTVDAGADEHRALIDPRDEQQPPVQPEIYLCRSVAGASALTSSAAFDSTTDRIARYIGQRWLRLESITVGLFVGLPWLAPVFAALGWWGLANPIYTAYAVT